MNFKDFGINNELIKDLENHGIVKPTIVQEKCIPLIMDGHNVLVQSETGSGKTIGFAIPTIQMTRRGGGVEVLVIAPTRELAKQVSEEYEKFSKTKGLITAIVYGGVGIEPQINKVSKADVVVGTPGRLLDLIHRGALNLTNTRFLVIDEADRLLDMGFIEDINEIISHMKSRKQTMMFSATINGKVIKLKEKYLPNSVEVFLERFLKQGVLKQLFYNIEQRDKLPLLVHIIKSLKEDDKVLVFSSTKRGAQFVNDALRANGAQVGCMHGDMTQNSRENILAKFAKSELKVLIATDVAARGIHVEDITHVINYDLPNDAETYTHRVGRTARQGRKGTAIILLAERDYPLMHKVKAEYGSKIERVEPPKFDWRIKLPQRNSRPRNFNSDSRSPHRGSRSYRR